MKPIRVGIIGCGVIASTAHMPAYAKQENVKLAYFCDSIPERADRAAKEYGGVAVYDYRELLTKQDLDAVSICTPNTLHAPTAIDFMRAGKDVLCEKPAAHTYEDALKMKQCADETGRILSIGVCNRFDSCVNRIKAHIDAGELGEVYHVYISFRAHRSIPGLGGDFTSKTASGGGALIDWGVHFIDLVMYCLGDPLPSTVSGQAFSKLGRDISGYTCTTMWSGPRKVGGVYDVDDSVAGFIRTEGAALTLHGAWAQNIGEREMFIDFMGDKAGIRMQYNTGKVPCSYTMYTAKDNALLTIQPEFETFNKYEVEIASFLNSVRTREKAQADISKAIITSQIMQALYDSSDARREIVL